MAGIGTDTGGIPAKEMLVIVGKGIGGGITAKNKIKLILN